ncbi:efflux RND transporter periplasmic adaptor subunit [Flavihumibacter petaseus]|uniref:Putative RND-type efflux pump membrane fusion protein n=1 Tax=Flavihumibacter petaseus NBRC 106054 TaxID=1220578 RepID=A0A0E9N7M8_9BACT|nr:efflux RND transporter periplasmic adaptor subunit [Flavihumibacter petaseus]GAO45721.1 putative RND-type efflux pump membrane fusion protein [Flavihumibacter petaseus NBRC 106054]
MLSKGILPISLITAALWFAACKQKQQAPQGPPPATPVTLYEVKAFQSTYADDYPGILVPLNQTELRSQVTGYVTGIYFKDGDKVKKGQRLYSIDAQLYDANYQNAIANMQVQETNLVKAQKDADRYNELDRQDAIAKQQVDYANAALEAAKKQVEAAKANVRSVQANVRFANITAPFDGTIGISQVRVGTSVVAGQTVMNTVSTDNPMAVDITIDQKDLYRFSLLSQNKNLVKDSVITISFGGLKYDHPGTISVMDRAVDPQTGTLKVRLSFPNAKSLLKAGMNTIVHIQNPAGHDEMVIPYKAVVEQLGEFFVYVAGDSSKAFQRKIKLGKQLDSTIIVKSGLSAGDKIVVQGVQNVREGAVINPAPQK